MQECEQLFRQALAIRRDLLGDDDLLVAESLNNLSGLMRQNGRLDEAIELQRESLDIRAAQLDDSAALPLFRLSLVLTALGEEEEAKALLARAQRLDPSLRA